MIHPWAVRHSCSTATAGKALLSSAKYSLVSSQTTELPRFPGMHGKRGYDSDAGRCTASSQELVFLVSFLWSCLGSACATTPVAQALLPLVAPALPPVVAPALLR